MLIFGTHYVNALGGIRMSKAFIKPGLMALAWLMAVGLW